MAKLNEPKKVPEKKKYIIIDSSSDDADSDAGEDKTMQDQTSQLIDTKPKPHKYKYHEATLTQNAYFSTNLASELRNSMKE